MMISSSLSKSRKNRSWGIITGLSRMICPKPMLTSRVKLIGVLLSSNLGKVLELAQNLLMLKKVRSKSNLKIKISETFTFHLVCLCLKTHKSRRPTGKTI
jgi:hypothetical protein